MDSSKLANQIVAIFFQKYAAQEYDNIVAKFFDKRGYLRKLINTAPIEDIDSSSRRISARGEYGSNGLEIICCVR